PNGGELAKYLGGIFYYPAAQDGTNLLRVAQYVVAREGLGPLYDELRNLFDANYPPTRVHEFFATLPHLLGQLGKPPYQVILTKTDIGQLIPAELLVKLTRSRFLFLGYSMQDWNLRVILHRIWGQQPLSYKSWAIQKQPNEIEQELWKARGVEVLDIPLESYV